MADKKDLEQQTTNQYSTMCRQLGEYINFVREEKGISLRDFYKQTSVSIAVMSDLENGVKVPRVETLLKIALALEIPLYFIFGNKFVPPEFKYDDKNLHKKPRSEELLRNTLLNLAYNKDEVKDIMNFVEFTKSKRSK